MRGWRDGGNRKILYEKVSIPYTFKERLFDNGQWRERPRIREILLPIDLAQQIAKAALKDAEAVSAIEEQLRTFAKETPMMPGEKPIPDEALLHSIEAEIKPILMQKPTNEKIGYQ